MPLKRLTSTDDVDGSLATYMGRKRDWSPVDLSLSAMSGDTDKYGSGQTISAGVLNGMRLFLPQASLIDTLWLMVLTGQTGLTNGRMVLADDSGSVLGLGGDMSTSWQTPAPRPATLASAVSCPAGFYNVGFWYTGTTSPSFARASASALNNVNLTAPLAKCFTGATGLTTGSGLTSIGTKAFSNISFWAGMSGSPIAGSPILTEYDATPQFPTSIKTGSYTLQLVDAGSMIETSSASANTLTVPANVFLPGTTIYGRQYGAGLTTIAAGSGLTIRSRGGALASAGQYAEWTLSFRSGTEAILTGDIA